MIEGLGQGSDKLEDAVTRLFFSLSLSNSHWFEMRRRVFFTYRLGVLLHVDRGQEVGKENRLYKYFLFILRIAKQLNPSTINPAC